MNLIDLDFKGFTVMFHLEFSAAWAPGIHRRFKFLDPCWLLTAPPRGPRPNDHQPSQTWPRLRSKDSKLLAIQLYSRPGLRPGLQKIWRLLAAIGLGYCFVGTYLIGQ